MAAAVARVAAPRPHCERANTKPTPGGGVGDDRHLHVADRRLATRAHDPVEPDLAAVGRASRLDARIDRTQMLHRRRRRIVQVAVKRRIAQHVEHGLGVAGAERLEDQVTGLEGLHAVAARQKSPASRQ
jgi:hypothetical protein